MGQHDHGQTGPAEGPEPRVVPEAVSPDSTAGPGSDRTATHAAGMAAGGGAGALAGAALGAVAGPGGMIVGAGLGAVAGIFAGRGVTEAIVSTDEEERYWREHHEGRPHARDPYDRYRPAYRYGWENAAAHVPHGRSFEMLEPEMERQWPRVGGGGGGEGGEMDWMTARPAARDAWERVESRIKRRGHDAGGMH